MFAIYKSRLFLAVSLVGALTGNAAATPMPRNAEGGNLPAKLFLAREGLALSAFPSRQSLSQEIKVTRTTGAKKVAWTATSNEPWLDVTPAGMTGGGLTVKAKPKGLTTDTLYVGTVTVTASDRGLMDTETLTVGFWVGSVDPQIVTLQQNAVSIATNPVSPIAYVAAGDSSILEYNVYSGALAGTFKKVAPTVGAMEVSGDGNTLFAADTTNYAIVALDATTGAKLHTFKLGYAIGSGFDMVYARPYGMPAIYAAGGPIIAYPSGQTLANGIAANFIAVPPDGRTIFDVTLGISPGALSSTDVTMSASTLTLTPEKSTTISGENCQDLAVSANGAHVYPACGAPYEFDVYDGKTLTQVQTLPGNHYPNNAEIDSRGDFVGGINGLYDSDDVFVYAQNGFSLGNVPTTPQSESEGQGGQLVKPSGDSTRVISATDAVYDSSQTLMFRDLP